MGSIEFSNLFFTLDDGRTLFDGVSFSVGSGEVAALIGDNGAGKSTLLKIASGSIALQSGAVNLQGSVKYMPQLVGAATGRITVRDLLLETCTPTLIAAAHEIEAAQARMLEIDDLVSQMRYADALAAWGDVGGYEEEVLWDVVTVSVLGQAYDVVKGRSLDSISGGEQKRLYLEKIFRSQSDVLILDEPDNFLDVPGKRWLESMLASSDKAVLLVSHDRELIGRAATKVVTLEERGAWVHGEGFETWSDARSRRNNRLSEVVRRWDEERDRLREMVRTMGVQAQYSTSMAARYRAAQTRLQKFESAGRPSAAPTDQVISPKLNGGRTAVRALRCDSVAIGEVVKEFDVDVYFGDRLLISGPNGAGKSHFLRLLAGEEIEHHGSWSFGSRVVPGLFMQSHAHPTWHRRTLVEILSFGDSVRPGLPRGASMSALNRYGIAKAADQFFETLSGGEQARFRILLLDVGGSNFLLLDEPTDNLDLVSAEALQRAIEGFDGTVVAVSHDRWFARSFSRHLVFASDGIVSERSFPSWEVSDIRPAQG